MNLNKKAVIEAARLCDGWTIFPADTFIKLGLPEEFVSKITAVHESSSDNPKHMIFGKAGVVVTKLEGVYGLTLLWRLAEEIGADTSIAASKIGRGFQADCLTAAIVKKLEES